MKRRILIIEDCRDELQDLSQIIQQYEDIELLAGATSVAEGRELIRQLRPEGIFLDISFQTEGKKKGLELAIELNLLPPLTRPWIIFITGNPKGHAAEITERNIHHDGFVKKPFSECDVAVGLNWIRDKYPCINKQRRIEIKYRANLHGKAAWITRFIGPEEIIFIEKNTNENTTRVHIVDDCIELDGVQRNIGDFEKLLQSFHIIRIQNSYLVNLQHIAGYDKERVYLKCKCGKQLPIGKSFEEHFHREYANF